MANNFVQVTEEVIVTGNVAKNDQTLSVGTLATQDLLQPEGTDEALTGETI